MQEKISFLKWKVVEVGASSLGQDSLEKKQSAYLSDNCKLNIRCLIFLD